MIEHFLILRSVLTCLGMTSDITSKLNWPSFMPLNANFMKHKHIVHWGRTDRDPGAPLEVELNTDLISRLEAAHKV